MENKSKRYMVTGILVLLIMMFTLLSSYAYWRITKTQTGVNVISASCLEINYIEDEDNENNPIKGFSLTDAWPITDEEGKSLKGYTFKLENTCKKEVNYEIVLESLETTNENYFDNNYIKIRLDNSAILRYSQLNNVDNDEAVEDVRETKLLLIGTIPGTEDENESNIKTHTIRTWISSDAGNDQIGKEFKSRIKVYAGQQISGNPNMDINNNIVLNNITEEVNNDLCYTFDETTKTVTDYDVENCGSELILPPAINGYPVEKIKLSNYYRISFSLTNVNLENASYLKEIGERTFYYYQGTNQELVIPDSVTSIGGSAFYRFNGPNLVLSSNLTTIADSAFRLYQGKNQELVIPDSVTSIGASAFQSFNGPNLVLSSNLTTIADSAFRLYQGTNQELVIPDSVTSIGASAFYRFNGPNLVLSSNLTTIADSAFAGYQGTDQELIIPDNVTSIGVSAFNSFDGTNLNLSNKLITIGQRAFRCYVGTGKSLIIPDNVIAIETQTFESFNGTNLVLNNSLTRINNLSFATYQGIININMSEADFDLVAKANDWKNANATLNYLVN